MVSDKLAAGFAAAILSGYLIWPTNRTIMSKLNIIASSACLAIIFAQ